MIILLLSFVVSFDELPDPLAAGWKGEPTCVVLEENTAVRVLKCTFPPGVGHEKHRHAPHWGYTLSGGKQRIVDASGEREVNVPTGYEWWSDGTVHEVVNSGDTTTEYLIVEPKGSEENNAIN